MASRRMFSKDKIETDRFLDLDPRTQALFFHLILNADDDGFVGSAKGLVRMTGCSTEDLDTLVDKDYLIRFESGVVLIKSWKVHNFIRKDRYHPSILPERDLICWTRKGEYMLKEDVVEAYDLETGEVLYPEGYIHYFDEDKEKEERKKRLNAYAGDGTPVAEQEEMPSEIPADDYPEESEEDYPENPEDDFSDDQDESDNDCGFTIIPEDSSCASTQATPEASSSLSALRSSLSPGSPLVAMRSPEDKSSGRSSGYPQRHSKKSLRLHCDRTPEPQYCTTGNGDSVSAVSKFSNSTARG